jgi:hypothetical protein
MRWTVHRSVKVAGRLRSAASQASSRLRRRARLAGKQWQKSVLKPLKRGVRF